MKASAAIVSILLLVACTDHPDGMPKVGAFVRFTLKTQRPAYGESGPLIPDFVRGQVKGYEGNFVVLHTGERIAIDQITSWQ